MHGNLVLCMNNYSFKKMCRIIKDVSTSFHNRSLSLLSMFRFFPSVVIILCCYFSCFHSWYKVVLFYSGWKFECNVSDIWQCRMLMLLMPFKTLKTMLRSSHQLCWRCNFMRFYCVNTHLFSILFTTRLLLRNILRFTIYCKIIITSTLSVLRFTTRLLLS